MKNNKIGLFQIQISNIEYINILKSIKNSFKEKEHLLITGANVNTVNLSLKDLKFAEVLSKFDIIHPDGIGVFLASRLLYSKNGIAKRITGSDFYIELLKESLKNNWSFFFFGDTHETLNRISENNPQLNIKGFCNGFYFNSTQLVNEINDSRPDILIVGLGSPKQEEWIIKNRDKINNNVIIAVGDGIKVFAGNKRRGPKLIQKIGLEWFIRLIFEPKRLWKRYIIGIPLFILRVIKFKLSINKNDLTA